MRNATLVLVLLAALLVASVAAQIIWGAGPMHLAAADGDSIMWGT